MEFLEIIASNQDKELIKACAVAIMHATGGRAQVVIAKLPKEKLHMKEDLYTVIGDSVAVEMYEKGMRMVKATELIDQALKNE